MMYRYIIKSIPVESKTKVNVWSEEYSIGTHKPGNPLLKVEIRESHLDSNASNFQTRIQVSTIDNFMATCGHGIYKLHGNVKGRLDLNKGRG